VIVAHSPISRERALENGTVLLPSSSDYRLLVTVLVKERREETIANAMLTRDSTIQSIDKPEVPYCPKQISRIPKHE
jgi:hypothetical protein